MPRPLKVFLCHAHSDKDPVKALYVRLKREGVDVWLDKEKLLPGADWEYEIRKAVRESDVVIVCLSKQFNQAGFRQKEVRIALEEADRKPEGEIFIIPARLEECDNLESLSRWHWVDLFEGDGFQRLILALRIRADKIGAALRQRGATLSRFKKNEEQQNAEKERIENARREDEEQERQRLAKEQADRDAVEKAERETAERETAEKIKREQAELDAAKRIASEKAEREKIELAQIKQPVGRVSNPTITTNENASRDANPKPAPVVEKKRKSVPTPTPKLNARLFGIGGIVLACLLLAVFGGNYLFNQIDSPVTTIPASATEFIANTTKTPTPALTKTIIPTPILPTFTPPPYIGDDGMTLVYVPAGEFAMGSDADDVLAECQKYFSSCQRNLFSNEEPQSMINIDAFWIDKTEVTNAMYAKCVADGDCTPPLSLKSITHDVYYNNSEFDDYPVIYVDWNQANAYCAWAGRKLPTEAQWEKAARGTDGRIYPWGNIFDETKGNFCDTDCFNYWANHSFNDGFVDVSPVGNYPDGVSIYGAMDMAGNAWEWVSSLYRPYPYDENDGRENLSVSESRVVRGGSWGYHDYGVRSAFRLSKYPLEEFNDLGFRCALSQP